MTDLAFCRRALLLALPLAAIAGCGGDDRSAPQGFAPLDYDYLNKLQLNVASISVDDSWTPAANSGQHVEYLSAVQPIDALRQMARERLIAAGNTGQARLVIEDASIIQGPERLDGRLAVRLDVSTSDGVRSGYAEARVMRSTTGLDESDDAERAAAYDLTRRMMDDMNVELEYQIRRRLREYLVGGSEASPAAAPVQSQDLAPPGSPAAVPAPPATPAPSIAPTPAPPASGPTPFDPTVFPSGPTPLAPPG